MVESIRSISSYSSGGFVIIVVVVVVVVVDVVSCGSSRMLVVVAVEVSDGSRSGSCVGRKVETGSSQFFKQIRH